MRVLCGTDRPRPSSTDFLGSTRLSISRTVAHRRAPSVHPPLRMAFKRSGVRLPQRNTRLGQPTRSSWNFGALGPFPNVRYPDFSHSARERLGEVAASCRGNLDWRLFAGWALGCENNARNVQRWPGDQGVEMADTLNRPTPRNARRSPG